MSLWLESIGLVWSGTDQTHDLVKYWFQVLVQTGSNRKHLHADLSYQQSVSSVARPIAKHCANPQTSGDSQG